MQRYCRLKWRSCGSQLRWSPANSCTKMTGAPLPVSSYQSFTPSDALACGMASSLLPDPDRGEVLVEEVAGAEGPALDVARDRDDAIAPEQRDRGGLGDQARLERA